MHPSRKAREASVRVVTALNEIPQAPWDACANPPDRPFYPFTTHDFLGALEESGSATARTGWAPCHLIVNDPDGSIAAVAPLYLKSHSQGEYVFDHSWADAFEQAGGQYYPKFVSSIPFTPATGPRLLVRPDAVTEQADEILMAGMCALAEQNGISSAHVLFPTLSQWERLGKNGFLLRAGTQFHWANEGFDRFDTFLASLSSRKRKQIRGERAKARENGIAIRWLTGRDLTEAHWDCFFAFYSDTGRRKWGQPYLSRRFFSLIGERLADHILLVMCERDGRPIAGALNFIGGDTLYGRYWGCVEDHRFLHFEACYYQAIDFALARGLRYVEAGAQGMHKLARGYLPRPTYSAHWIADPHFRAAVARFLDAERRAIDADRAALEAFGPYRRDRTRSNDEKDATI